MTDQEYRQSVMEDWDSFDYKIPGYDNSKSLDDVITNDNGNANNEINSFVDNEEHNEDVEHHIHLK
jgi:hypothetical protein